MSAIDPELWARAVIALAVALGAVRLFWWRSAAAEARGPLWRFALLIAIQPAVGALLHLVLFPPSVATRTGTLVVSTGGASGRIVREPGDVRVTLPEADAAAGAERVPDLATAFRRWPAAARVRIEGAGLAPRDQHRLPVPLAFEAPPQPQGLIEVAFPRPAAPGGAFAVGGQVGALPAGAVELVDPAQAVVDRLRVTPGQHFVLTGAARMPGLALFTLRLRDGAGRLVEEVAVPLQTLEQSPPRVRVLAGAPGAEVKFLRRWAEESDIDLAVEIDVGAGVQLGDPPLPLTRAALSEIDLVVVDDRRWDALGEGQRAALAGGVSDGLGLLLRPTGPLSLETRRSWAALGLPLSGGDQTRPLRPPSTLRSAPKAGSSDGDAAATMPELTRLDLGHGGPQAVSLLRDGEGAPLATWRARGRGRVGVWTVTDSYALVLTGRPDRYNDLWSGLFSALARAGADDRLRVEGFPRAGERVTLCGILGEASVAGPRGARRLFVDPASGIHACAGYWPEAPGWRLALDGQGRETAFYVHPRGAAPSLAAVRNRDATLALVSLDRPRKGSPPAQERAPGSPWPWFAGLLAVLAALWWLERRRGFEQSRPTYTGA